MKKILFFVCTLLYANVLFAQTFEIDGLHYRVTSTNPAKVEVNDANESITTANIPTTVPYNGTPYSVTSIGSSAFNNCSSLTSVTIPNSVTSIGEYAFYHCESLTSVDIPNSVTSIGRYAFYWCSSLTSVTIPNSVISIGEYAFYHCSSLTSVIIPNSVTSIGRYAFYWCSSLTSIDIPNSVTSIGDNAFAWCSSLTSIDIPNSVTSIGLSAFYACNSLTSVTIPNSVTSIGGYAFEYCSSLTSVTIPNSVTSIGYAAFRYCSSLISVILPNNANISSDAFENTGGINVAGIYYGGKETVNIGNYTFNNVGFIKFYLNGNATTITPSEVSVIDCDESLSGDIVIPSILSYQGANYSVTSIGDEAFEDCSSLTSVNIPNSVASIGRYAFYYCSSLTSITIPNSVTSIGVSAFHGCSSLTSVTIPNSITSIGDFAFAWCSSLTSIDIPNSVTSIGGYAFNSCSSLTSVTIPNSVTSIGNGTFRFCSSLTSIDIPNSVTSIGTWAFEYCSSLTSVTCLNETAPSLGESVFSSTPSTKTLTYPCGATGYSTNWGNTTWASVNEDCPALEIGEQFTIGDFTYEVTSANEVAVKTYNNNTATSTEIPSTVTYQGTTYSVTFIKGKAFYNKDNLTSVTIPNSVTAIGTSSDFYGAFDECDGLTSISIPNSVTSIGNWTFYRCSSLTSVTIPNSVTSIEDGAFMYCSSLTSIDIPNSVTSIRSNAFKNCSSLTSVTLPNNANISSNAFENTGAINVDGIYYGGAETVNIGNYTFNNVGFVTFYLDGNAYTPTLTEVSVIDCDVNKSGDIVIPSILSYQGINYSVTSIGEDAFYSCDDLTSVTIPNSIISIGYRAFGSCYSLTSVTIPNSVTSIGNDAFYYCSSLTSVDIPNSVTSIGTWAFASCYDLTSVTIGNSVTSIGNSAFRNCSSLDSVTCLAETAPTLSTSVFSGTPSPVLNIPFGSDYSSWQGVTTWSKTNYLIQEGETKELSNDFTINSTTGLKNEGVLRIKQGGQLINQTATNVEGIIEVEAINRENNWNYIGAPFANNYQLGAILPQVNDVSVSTFNHNTGNWNTNWATNETEIPTGEGFAAWNWGASPITFTTYGDIWNYETNQAGKYNFEQDPTYTLNNQDEITITHQDNNSEDNVNWLSVANPYTFKLDIAQIRTDNELQGDVLYTYNGTTFQPVETGEISVTEGFFVNNTTLKFKKGQRKTNIAKSTKQKDYIKLIMTDADTQAELLFTQNDKANANYDRFDANKLFSPKEITEPYFVTDGKALVKEEVKEYPYTATLNIRNYETKEVTISIDNIPEGVNVFLLDNGQDIKMNGGVEYTTTITEGENADRFKVLFKKQHRLEKINDNQITITNNNRHISVKSDKTDLNIEVYNTLGQKVHTTKDYTFTLDHLPSGSYLIKAFKGRQTKTEKIVIE